MKFVRSLRITAVIVAMALASATASAKGYFHEILNLPSGYPYRITSICVTNGGYIWAGSDTGLVRLDYYNYKLYTADGSERSLPGNVIESVVEDSSGHIWVCTGDGAALYCPETDDFEQIKIVDEDGSSRNVIAHSIIETGNTVLIGGSNYLYSFNPDTHTVSSIKKISDDSPFIVNRIFRVGDDFLLLDQVKGFLHYSNKTGAILRSSLDVSGSVCAYMDSRGYLWRSKFNGGLECYSVDGQLVTSYNMMNSDVAGDAFVSIIERKGEIWAATLVGGISIIDPVTRSVRTLRNNPDDPNSFPSSSILSMVCDHNDNVWASMSKGGIIVLREGYNKFFSVAPNMTQSGNLSQSIRCFVEDENTVWLGTETNGLHSMAKGSDLIRHYPSTSDFSIQSMAVLSHDKLLLYCYTVGLVVFDKRTGAVSPFQLHNRVLDDNENHRLSYSYLSNDTQGNLLIAVGESVFRYVPGTGEAEKIEMPQHDASDIFLRVLGGKNDYYHTSRYIMSWDPALRSFTVLFDAGCKGVINSVAQGPNGTFWLATSKGIAKYERVSSTYTEVETDLFPRASSIACDYKGRVWIGADAHAYVYLPGHNNFVLLDVSNGVYPNNYSRVSRCITSEGFLYMGGSNGFVRADLSATFDAADTPVMKLMSAKVDGLDLEKDLSMRLPAHYHELVVRVFASERDVLRHKKFRFKIVSPTGRELIQVEDSPETAITYKRAGVYHAYASCTMDNGEWTDWTPILKYRVNAIWYLSAWFFFALFVLLSGSVMMAIKRQAHKKAEEERHKSDADRIKFLLNVSHELKTPLTLIIGPLDRILKETQSDDPNYGKISNALRQALRMRTLILTVLDAHKIEEGAAKLNAEAQKYNVWVNDIAQSFREEMTGRSIQLRVNYDTRVTDVPIDSQKLENVLTNLLINALKHSPNDSTVTVGTEYLTDTRMIRTYVADRGPGLGGVDAEKLFSRYYQGITEKTGSGMGLAYANTIVNLHGGRMGAKDNKDGGAMFYFDIPWEAAAVSEVKPVNTLDVTDVSESVVLVVDDDNDLRAYLNEEMEGIAKKVVLAVDGKDATEVLKREKVDVIVSDVRMPNMNGFELCEYVKTSPEYAHIPVILLTTRADAENRDKGIKSGADEYVTKPFEIPVLADTINNILRRG